MHRLVRHSLFDESLSPVLQVTIHSTCDVEGSFGILDFTEVDDIVVSVEQQIYLRSRLVSRAFFAAKIRKSIEIACGMWLKNIDSARYRTLTAYKGRFTSHSSTL